MSDTVIFSSCGNDSVALIQWAIENNKLDKVIYSYTGWEAPFWRERVEKVKAWVKDNGGEFFIIGSEGLPALVTRKKGFPMNGAAFCSYELKIKPAGYWLEANDLKKELTCMTGVRRCESPKRSDWPEWIEESENHGGRSLHSPLVRHDDAMRNELVIKAGFDVLPHRSAECWPCVQANKGDIAMLDLDSIERLDNLEKSLGLGKRSGNPKYMFRAANKNGASGIREVYKWATEERYIKGQESLSFCDSGFCGQ